MFPARFVFNNRAFCVEINSVGNALADAKVKI